MRPARPFSGSTTSYCRKGPRRWWPTAQSCARFKAELDSQDSWKGQVSNSGPAHAYVVRVAVEPKVPNKFWLRQIFHRVSESLLVSRQTGIAGAHVLPAWIRITSGEIGEAFNHAPRVRLDFLWATPTGEQTHIQPRVQGCAFPRGLLARPIVYELVNLFPITVPAWSHPA